MKKEFIKKLIRLLGLTLIITNINYTPASAKWIKDSKNNWNIKKLLKNLVDMKIEVYPTESYARNFTKVSREALEPVLFEVYQNESSGSWRPGISLFFDNPAEIEIAVPNEHQESELGYIIIRCTTPHPHADLLNNRIFKNADEACMALSNFLSESLANYKIEKNDE